jgi:folate-binding protein YgfZ
VEAAIVERAFIRVAGPDAETFLQGQLSQDVSSGSGLSFLLDPTGKVVAFLRFGREGDGFLLDTDPEAGDAVVARLQRFLLRTKAEIGLVDDVALVRTFGAPPLPQAQAVPAWVPGEGVQDVLGDDAAALLAGLGADPIGEDEHERRRILAVVPRSGVDIGPATIPAESGRWTIEVGVSFTKGCYTGQELVARIDSRGGNVPHPLRLVRFGSPVAAGERVKDAGGAELGVLTSATGDVALAPLPRRTEVGGQVWAEGVPGVVER